MKQALKEQALEILNTNEAQHSLETVVENTVLSFDAVRSHHAKYYRSLLLAVAEHPEMSPADIAIAEANDEVSEMWITFDIIRRLSPPSPQGAYAFREHFGADGTDDSLPTFLTEDYIGLNGIDMVGYRNRRALDNLAFLTSDGRQSVKVGRVKDGMCRAATCGIHCELFSAQVEDDKLLELYNALISYFALPEIQASMTANPDRFAIKIDKTEWDTPHPTAMYDEGSLWTRYDKLEVRQIELTLDLLRDVFVCQVTNGKYKTYADLLARAD